MYKLYTDGSCFPNPGIGSYAYLIIVDNNNIYQDSRISTEKSTTNNRMELEAIIQGLTTICRHDEINIKLELYTDSLYCKRIIDNINKDFNYYKYKEAKNLDLIKNLQYYLYFMEVKCHHVKAHNGDTNNELVDRLAYNKLSAYYKKVLKKPMTIGTIKEFKTIKMKPLNKKKLVENKNKLRELIEKRKLDNIKLAFDKG